MLDGNIYIKKLSINYATINRRLWVIDIINATNHNMWNRKLQYSRGKNKKIIKWFK